MREATRVATSIPKRLNLTLLVVGSLLAATTLHVASNAARGALVAVPAVAFSFVANTLFSLLHESVHGTFHPHRTVNRWAGRLCAAWFPTGLSLQRAFHLTHHRNNRSPFEQFDYVRDGDVRWLKYAQWYAIMTGLYWLVATVGAVVLTVVPASLLKGLRDRRSKVARQTSSAPYLEAALRMSPFTWRAEVFFSAAFQVGLWFVLDLTWTGWLWCYGAFALQWSGLQYADHAFSPLDPIRGAWNLRVPRWWRLIFLNYHCHRAHHQHPDVPWMHLPALVDPREDQPSYFRMWCSMWAGPRRLPKTNP